MPITFNSAGGFLAGTISSSGNDIFITTSGSVGAINIGQQLQLTGSQIIEKDSTGNIRNKKTFNTDGSITQEKFDTGGKTTETKVKDPDKGKEFIRSGSSTTNQIEFTQNSSGAFISVSGSLPGYNVINANRKSYRLIRETNDQYFDLSNPEFNLWTNGIAQTDVTTGGVTVKSGSFVFSSATNLSSPILILSSSGKVIIPGTLQAQEFHTEFTSASIVLTSGSTIFGNSHDDTHTFTGTFVNAITASGEISSSDRVIAKRFNADGTLEGAGGYAFRLRDDTGMYEEGFNVGVLAPENVQIAIDSNNNNNDISDPAQFVIVHNNAVLDSSPASPLFQVFEDGRTLFSTASVAGVTINHSTGHITASGDISASGTITAISMSGDGSTLTGSTSAFPTGVVSSSGFNFTGTGTFNDDITIVEGKSIIFDSTDTFIKSNTDNPEDLQIAADEDIFLSPDDNLFIQHGSTTWVTFDGDNRKVTINGALNLSQSAGIGSSFEAPTTAVHTLRFDSDRFRFWAGGSERLTILSASGNIGIGTSAPVSALHVEEGDIRIDTAENGTQALRFSDRNTTKAQIQYVDNGEKLNILTGGSTNAIEITNTQNVKFSGPLTASGDISGSSTSTGSFGHIKIGGTNIKTFISSSAAADGFGGGGGAVSAVANGTNNRVATFSSADALNGEANLTFDGSTFVVNGRTKFGTTGGTSNTSHQFYAQSGDTNFFLIADADGEEVMKGEGSVGGGDLKYTFGDNAVAGNGTLFQLDEANNKFILHNDANDSKVGINTTAPTKALQVSGEISSSGGFIGGATQNTGSYDFPGAIVGYNVQGLNVGHASYNLTTTFAVPDAGMHVQFQAPKSGIVEIEVQTQLDMGSSAGTPFYLALSDAATYNQVATYYEQYVCDPDENDDVAITHKWVVPSLTPGTTYKYWMGAKVLSTSGTPKLLWGGNGSSRFRDFIMKATALPSNTEIET